MSHPQYELIRNAVVEVTAIGSRKGVSAEITVNGKYQHRFPHTSRISKHLSIMQPADLAERLSGGSYFFVKSDDESTMVDFRDGQYVGFIHEDKTIDKFIETLGFQPMSNLPLHRTRRSSADEEYNGGKVVLRKVWSDGEIQVPGYAAGGEFTSQLSFVWNPFVKTINSSFDLVRLICANGMIGLTSFLNTKVPLFNRWEEHLDIASRQIQNKVNTIVVDRVQTMATERASVGQCLLLEQHIVDRLYSPTTKSEDERKRLLALMAAISPKTHLGNVYKDSVFVEKALAAQLPAHLTQFDAWNIATELRSHTHDAVKSSGNALDRFANNLMFDDDASFTASVGRFGGVRQSAFSSPERAFFGKLN